MKKCKVILCTLVMSLFFCSGVYSQPLPGSYDSRNGDFNAGAWSETLYGGSEGAPGNEITSGATGYYQFQGARLDNAVLLGSPTTENRFYEYRTVYKGGELTLYNNSSAHPLAGWYNPGDEDGASVINLENTIVITKKYVDTEGSLTGDIEFALMVVDAKFKDYPGYTASVTAKYDKAKPIPVAGSDPLTYGDVLTWTIIAIQGPPVVYVPVDIKPGSCPNPVNVKSRGVLPVAILGTAEFHVNQIDPASIRLNGVSPLRWRSEDVAAPFEPFVGKEGAYACTENGPDGYMDLGLKFDTQDFVKSLGSVNNRATIVVGLSGMLRDGTQIQGEDVIIILQNGNKSDSVSNGNGNTNNKNR
jgi:hypothetical protein